MPKTHIQGENSYSQETPRKRFYKAIPCDLCTLMVPRPSMTEHQEFYCPKRSARPEALPICNFCENPITGKPVRDSQEIFWVVKANARTWCNDNCVQSDAERGL